jgi:glucan phosphoethanolaminetransferase (alkaline phosphatase superfamily)
MKDINISAKRIKTEMFTLLVCFFIGFAANIGAVIYYKSAVIEIITSLPYVLVFMVAIYCLWSFLRLIKWLIAGKSRKSLQTKN